MHDTRHIGHMGHIRHIGHMGHIGHTSMHTPSLVIDAVHVDSLQRHHLSVRLPLRSVHDGELA
jgi:hypothetical protein